MTEPVEPPEPDEPDPIEPPEPDPIGPPAEPDQAPTEPDGSPTEPDQAPAEPTGPPAEPATSATTHTSIPAVESTRRLLGASFDLLTRTSDDMRRASFYIGIIVFGTVGPLALASLALAVVSIHLTSNEMDVLMKSGVEGWVVLLGYLAGFGILVAAVESRAMAAAILGGHLSGRSIVGRAAVARSRMVFWRVIAASIIAGIPVLIAQSVVSAAFVDALGSQTDVSLVTSALVAAVVGAPFAYMLSGVVLGDVGAFESMRRSFRVFRARKLAAALVAVFETSAILVVFLGLGAGLDLALRVFDALGLGTDSGPAGLVLVTIGLIGGVFAFGTLIFTALSISLAPQVVMFVGLTRATFGLDHVAPGGDHDPAVRRQGQRRFRRLTRPMLLGFATGAVGLLVVLAMVAG